MSETMQPQLLTPAEQLLHTTVRLECETANGLVTGTGFFFRFMIDETQYVPLIVSNKHVIDGALKGTFVITKGTNEGWPIVGDHEKIVLDNFESRWIKHPDANVDLAVFPFASLLVETQQRGVTLFCRTIDETFLPTPNTWQSLSVIEEITMIGYPNGIWDQKNNMPIVRRGITATNPRLDYNGAPFFVIDCACFPGSSGSPVLVFNQGGYTDAKGNMNLGANRVILLGILFAGPQHVARGEVKTITVPLNDVTISLSQIPNNLGFVVKSERLRDFRPILLGT